MKKSILVIMLTLLCFTSMIPAQNDSLTTSFLFNRNAIVFQLSPNVFAEILPEIELLSGVLSQTSWIKQAGPVGNGNKYFQRLKSFFKEYENNEAIKLAQELNDRGFGFDAPPGFILQLGPLPDLEKSIIPENYINRAGGMEILEKFRIALRNLSQESKFLEFFLSERKYLKEVVESTIKGFDAARITKWLNDFFGYKGDEFHILFAPAMFPGGGYGASRTIGDKKIVFQVIREQGLSQDKPFFCNPMDLVALTFHEFGHAFINPAFEEYNKLIEELKLGDLFNPVETKMRNMAYPTLGTFINELHVRAMTIIALEEYAGGSVSTVKLIEMEKERGFYPIVYTYSKLKEYSESRKYYPTFKKFIPDLLHEYGNNKNELLKLAE